MAKPVKMEPWEIVQVKTFTKWVSAKLVKAGFRDTVTDLMTDLSSGIALAHLLEAISNEKLPKLNMNPKMNIHKIQNLNICIDYIKRHIRVFVSAEDFINGEKKAILGCIWTIILRWEIQDISVEDMNAKEGLLLWCQKKTQGYKGVDVKDFTRSWHDGLAFNALIHKHRPDLLDFDSLNKGDPEKNLELAFSIAEKELNIPRFFDVEDVAVADERSIMTYLLQFFHLFSANRKAEAAGKCISKLIDNDLTNEQLKDKYEQLAKDIMDWINAKKPEMANTDFPNDLDAVKKAMDEFKDYQKGEKPPKEAEKIGAEGIYNNLQNKLRNANRPLYQPPSGLAPSDLNAAWDDLMKAEAEKEKILNAELDRLKKIEDLLKRFNERLNKLNQFNDEKQDYLAKRPEINSLVAAKSEVKMMEGHGKAFDQSKRRVDELNKLGQQIIDLDYKDKDKVKASMDDIDGKWKDLDAKGQDKEKWAKDELERQEKIEKLRLDIADKMADLMRWYKDNTEALEDAHFPDEGLEEILAFRPEVDAKEADLKKTATAKDEEVAALWKDLEALGVTDNKYSDYTMDDVAKAHGDLDNAIDKYKQDYEAEVKRQEDMEAKRKEFAAAAQEFVDFLAEQKKEIEALKGEPLEMTEAVKAVWRESEPQEEKLRALRKLDDECRAMGIRKNKYTPHTINTLEIASGDHDLFVHDLLNYLEEERKLKHEYVERATRSNEWNTTTAEKHRDIQFDGTLAGVKALYDQHRAWRNSEKPSKTVEKDFILKLFETIQKTLEEHGREAYVPPEGLAPENVKAKFDEMDEAEKARWQAILDEFARMQKLDKLIKRFDDDVAEHGEWALRAKEYLVEPVAFETLTQGQIALNMLEVAVKNRDAMADHVVDIKRMAKEIEEQRYPGIEEVNGKVAKVDADVTEIEQLENKRRDDINKLMDELGVRNQLGLDFAKLAKEYATFVEDVATRVSGSVFGDSLETVTAYGATKDEDNAKIREDDAAKRAAIDAVLAKWKELEMTSTPHTKMTEADITRLAQELEDALKARDDAYAAELDRQQKMEDKRKEFAAAVDTFLQALAAEREAIDGAVDANPKALTAKITDIHGEGKALAEKAADCQRIHGEALALEVTSNPYTRENAKTVNFKLAEHKKYVAAYLAFLRDEERNKDRYEDGARALVDWLKAQLEELPKLELDNTLAGVRKEVAALKKWRNSERAQRVADKKRLQNDHEDIVESLKVSPYKRLEYDAGELSPQAIDELFAKLKDAEKAKDDALQAELKKQEQLSRAVRDFKENADDLSKWTKEKKDFLEHEVEVNSLLAAKIQLDLIDNFDKDYAAQGKEMNDLTAAKDKLVTENSPDKDTVEQVHADVDGKYKELDPLSKNKNDKLKELEQREADAEEARAQFAKLAGAFDKYARVMPPKILKFHFGSSLKAVNEYQTKMDAENAEIMGKVDEQKAAIDAADARLKELGVTINDHTLLKMEDIEEGKKKIVDAIAERTAQYQKERERQNAMEEKRKEFAAASKALLDAIDANKAELDTVTEGEPEEKINKVTAIYDEAKKLKELHAEVDRLDGEQKALGVKTNKLALPLKECTARVNKHEKYFKNLLKALEEERVRNERKKERQAEQAKKEDLENRRNEFIQKSSALTEWMENAEVELTSGDVLDSLKELEAIKATLKEIKAQRETHTPTFGELLKMAEGLQAEGADVNAERFASSWKNVFTLIEERDKFIAEEEPRQKQIEDLRRKFAARATEFVKMLEDERKKELTGTVAEQLSQVNGDVKRVSEAVAKGATELSDLNEGLVNLNVRGNPYTDYTIKGMKEMSESLIESLTSRRSLLEQQLNAESGSKASPEEIEEYRELFHTFAKGGNGLKWFEFKAVLSALGDDCDDDTAKRTVEKYDADGNGEIEFSEFMDFMIQRREASDSPEAIIESFREIAGGKDYITENELAAHLTPAQLAHAKKVMPRKGEGYDYTAYVSK